MCNDPATFQRLVNTVLAGLTNCNTYLDDLTISTETWKEHVWVLEQVFSRLAQATLTINLAKCDFGKATVIYLGRQVGQGQVWPVEAKVTAITEFPIPTTRKALGQFLRMEGYYRGFCHNFSTVAKPLTNLLRPKVDFRLVSRVEVDASAAGTGTVLLQEDVNRVDHPMCYFSCKFNRHQTKYSTTEKEALALLLALQHFEVYVGSSSLPVVTYTDHNPLVFLPCMYHHNQRLMQWALVMQDYNLDVRHKKGSENVLDDALSRV